MLWFRSTAEAAIEMILYEGPDAQTLPWQEQPKAACQGHFSRTTDLLMLFSLTAGCHGEVMKLLWYGVFRVRFGLFPGVF